MTATVTRTVSAGAPPPQAVRVEPQLATLAAVALRIYNEESRGTVDQAPVRALERDRMLVHAVALGDAATARSRAARLMAGASHITGIRILSARAPARGRVAPVRGGGQATAAARSARRPGAGLDPGRARLRLARPPRDRHRGGGARLERPRARLAGGGHACEAASLRAASQSPAGRTRRRRSSSLVGPGSALRSGCFSRCSRGRVTISSSASESSSSVASGLSPGRASGSA